MAKLKKEQIKAAAQEAISDSEGYDTDELQELHRTALDYYYNRPGAAPSMEGRSALQSSDVADMIEAVTSQVMPAFELDSVAEFDALSEEDVEQSRTESNAVNWVVMQQNNGFYEIQQAVRDALLLRNGIIKVSLEEKERVTVERYRGLTEVEYGQLAMGQNENLNEVENGYRLDDVEEEAGFYSCKVTRKETRRKVCTQAVDPTFFMWERDWSSIYLQ
jgi:hypothetical protein